MADKDFDFESIFSELDAVAAPRATLVSGAPASDYGSIGNNILGYSRAYLAGPTFGLSKDIEAGLASLVGPESYEQELANINAQQRAFIAENPLAGTATEMASGYVLNPLGALGSLGKGATLASTAPILRPVLRAADTVVGKAPGIRIATKLASSVPAQGFATGYFGADPTISSPVLEGAKGAALATVGAGAANILGRGLSRLATESDKLLLGSFGITTADLGKSIKKAQMVGADLSDATDIPIAKTIKGLNNTGIISAENEVFENIGGIVRYQDTLSGDLSTQLEGLDKVSKPFRGFQSANTNRFIDGLAGTQQDLARAAVKKERAAIIKQFANKGTIADLQKAKTGLNYSWDRQPFTQDIHKALRADLRKEIEDRAARLAKKGLIAPDASQRIIDTNKAWGAAAEAKDLFAKKAARDLGPDAVEEAFLQFRTTGAAGSLNIASAASGSAIPALVGAAASLARTSKGKQFLGEMLEDPLTQKLGAKIGDLLQEYGTGRSAAIAGGKYEQSRKEDTAKSRAVRDRAPSSGAARDYKSILGISSSQVTKEPISLSSGDVKEQIMAQPAFIQAIISVESKGDPKAVSSAGAKGLMQLMDPTAADLKVKNSFDPSENIRGGSEYINKKLKKYKDKNIALAAYNWGPGRIDKSIARLESKGRKVTWDNLLKYTSVPTETREYVQRVRSAEGSISKDPAKYWDTILNKRSYKA